MDSWNLTLDHSCFDDDESLQQKIVIGGNDVTQTLKRVSGLVNQCDSSQLEDQLTICFPGHVETDDVPSVIQLAKEVAFKLKFFSRATQELVIGTCKAIFPQVIEQEHSTQIKHYFEWVEVCLAHAKEIGDSFILVSVFEVIEKAYCACSLKSSINNSPDDVFKHSSRILLVALPAIEQPNFDHDMAQLLKPLISIGQYSCKLDAKSMAFIWKLLLKMLQQNPDLSRKLELGASLLFLVQEILRLFDLLRQNVTNVSKLTKIAGFLIKVVVGLVEKDDTILEGEKENEAALTLVLHLLKYTPDIVKYELQLSEDLVRLLELHVAIAVHPLLENLLRSGPFLKVSLRRDMFSSQPRTVDRLSFIRLLGLLLTPSYQSLNLNSDSLYNLLDLFLSNVDQAHAEFNLPLELNGIVHSGLGTYTVPVYELLVTQACSGMAVALPCNIVDCVALLIRAVASAGFWASLMAADILCFTARYGTSQFCLDLVQHIFNLSTSTMDTRLISLLNRLVPLLSPAGRSALLKSHPVEAHPNLWALIHWNSFPSEQQILFQRSLSPPSGPPRASTLLRLHSLSASNNHFVNESIPSLIKPVSLLSASLNQTAAKEYRKYVELLLPCLFRVLLRTIQPDQKEQHLHLVQILKCAMEAKILPSAMLCVAEFLAGMGTKGVAPSAQQPAILRLIASLFCEITSSSSFLVQQEALRAFELFFKTTPHAQLASTSLREGQDSLVKDFIQRKAVKRPVANLAAFWRNQTQDLLKAPRIPDPLPKLPEIMDTSSSLSSCPTAKRPRLEGDEQLQFLMGNLSKIVADIGQHRPLPNWSKEEIQQRITLLNSYL